MDMLLAVFGDQTLMVGYAFYIAYAVLAFFAIFAPLKKLTFGEALVVRGACVTLAFILFVLGWFLQGAAQAATFGRY